jgi:diguanylate cyclase (GGDEF)-like protein
MRVLVAEDDPISRRRLEKRLAEWGYEVVTVDDGGQAWSVLQDSQPPPLAVLDWMMPILDGPEICRRLRRSEAPSYTYVLLLTGKNAKEDVIEGLEAGADDYVTKPFDVQELEVRLRIGRRIIAMQAELQLRATRDPLTMAWNRGATIDMLTRETSRATHTGAPISVVLSDVDHFKRVNDEYGHLAGDEVLQETVRRMSDSMRPYDMVGRYGGEEFLMILPGCDETGAATVAERLRAGVAGGAFTALGREIPVTSSFGVAELAAGETVHGLLLRADEALYAAKRAGRNRVVVAERGTTGPHAAPQAPSPEERYAP